MPKKPPVKKTVSSFSHTGETRKNIPTAELQSVVDNDTKTPRPLKYPRNTELDPQIVWRGKDEQDWSDLVVNAPPLYIQEKLHPKALIDDLLRQAGTEAKADSAQPDLFADFNGIPEGVDKTEFYRHDQNWSNRMILGDSLQVMASLAEREGLKGKVQCIYFDPPYGIKFNSNFQWSTTSRDVKDGKAEHITREPEQVKAFRDTWRDGIHSYLTYLRDRLTVARDLLHESGSIFVQIGDENVHRVRSLMDEVFGEENFVSEILLKKGGTATSNYLPSTSDFILFYAKYKNLLKYKQLFEGKIVGVGDSTGERYDQIEDEKLQRRAMTRDEKINPNLISGKCKVFKQSNPCSQHDNPQHRKIPLVIQGNNYFPPTDRQWSSNLECMYRVVRSNRIMPTGKNLAYIMYIDDFPVVPINNFWTDTLMRSSRIYIVETATSVIQRCILMTTDPGDLVLDPTCGSGTTAYTAEQWGRRWITIDTSRVALALARARLMGARYPYYLLADSEEGCRKELDLGGNAAPVLNKSFYNRLRYGFVYERVPHITLKSIANNAEIDVIWEQYQGEVEAARGKLNAVLRTAALGGQKINFKVETGGRQGKSIDFSAAEDAVDTLPSGETVSAHELLEWEIPQEAPADWPKAAAEALNAFRQARIKRQKQIDASIAARAEFEYLYDKPFEDKRKIRVSGPFTVESISPHRVLGVDENGNVIDRSADASWSEVREEEPGYGFTEIILDNLKTAGVQSVRREDRINFTSLMPWPGRLVCAEGTYREGDDETGADRRAAIFIGPEFGTVSRPDLIEATREAADSGFDILIACAFNYEAHTTEFEKLGKVKILKARMNADLHMAEDLRNTGKGNLFVVFGEPDIDVEKVSGGQLRVHIKGVDVFRPNTGEIVSDDTDGIACWFIDTDYNEESFFVRHAYFLGATDPYNALKTSLKAEINEDAWAALHSAVSRPFDKPASGRIAVKVINHLGDEVMKVVNVNTAR